MRNRSAEAKKALFEMARKFRYLNYREVPLVPSTLLAPYQAIITSLQVSQNPHWVPGPYSDDVDMYKTVDIFNIRIHFLCGVIDKALVQRLSIYRILLK